MLYNIKFNKTLLLNPFIRDEVAFDLYPITDAVVIILYISL